MMIHCGMAVMRMGMLEVREDDESTNCEDGDSDTDWSRYIESDMLCVLSV